MSKETLRTSVLGELAKWSVAALLGALALWGTHVWTDAGAPALDLALSGLSKALLFQLCLLLLLLCIASWLWCWIISRRAEIPLTMKFAFDEHGGHYIDPKTGAAICPKCLADGVVVHMMNVGGPKMCNACRCACRGPDIPKKPKP